MMESVGVFSSILLGGLVVESVVETIKMLFGDGKFNISKLGSLIFGVLLAIAYNLDLLSLIGLNSTIPFVGCIITGVFLSRGSGFIHDLLEAIFNIFDMTENKK